MFKYSVKLILRQLLKGNRQLLLNVLGLSIAFAVVLFLSTFIFTELSRGKSIKDYQNLYRLSAQEGVYWSARSIDEFSDKFPEIKGLTRVHANWSDKSYYEFDKKLYSAGKIMFADKHFFDLFQYNVIIGNLTDALSLKDILVLTEAEAIKIFGKVDVVGRSLHFRTSSFGEMDLNVAAVIENQPPEAMMKFDAIIPVAALEHNVPWYKSNHWGNSRYEVYVSLFNNDSKAELEKKINAAFQKAAPDWEVKDKGHIFLRPYSTLYFSEGQEDVLIHSNAKRVKILGAIMVIVFSLALINFISLNTAQKIKKARNIGIHKALGAGVLNSFVRVSAEILPVLVLTFIIAFLLVSVSLPLLNKLFDSSFCFFDFINLNSLVTGLCVLTSTLFLSTTFIAVYFQRYKVYQILKNKSYGDKENLRNALLVAQFTLSITLIIASMVIYKQNTFMQNKSMGFKKDNILYLPVHGQISDHIKAFKHELAGISEIKTMTMSSSALGKVDMSWGMSLNDNGDEKRVSYTAMKVEENFFDFFGIKILKGESFRPTSIREHEHIFNETAIKAFGIDEIKNTRISSYDNASGEIIGEVEDFNFQSLHHVISPIGFICSEPEDLQFIYMNLQLGDESQMQKTLGKIETVWNKFSNGWPFELHFLDQTLDNLYHEDRKFSKVFLLATILAVFIGCLGLLSTAIFVVELRIKEVGIRKVNGAKVTELLVMLNKDFVKWVAIAFVVATPIAYYAMNKWIENFAYKTTLSWWIFALAGLLALGIALLTVSWLSWRAATRNPVEALRYE